MRENIFVLLLILGKRHFIFHYKQDVSHEFFISALYQDALMAQTVKRLPTMWETRVQSLGPEDLLKKEMTTHSSTLAWKISWTEDPVGYSPWGHTESDTTEPLHFTPSV